MKKGMAVTGIVFLVLTVVLVVLGTNARSMFYGIMDAPYSVYGKYWTYMKYYYIGAGISFLAAAACLVFCRRK